MSCGIAVGPPTGSMFSLQIDLHDGEVRTEDGVTYLTTEAAERARLRDDRFKYCKPIIRNLKMRTRPQMPTDELNQVLKDLGEMKVYPCVEDANLRIPPPFITFNDAFEGNDHILSIIKSSGFDKPSPVQCQMWAALMEGMDCIGVSQTGSGKTLAFLLPALLHIDAQYRCYQYFEKKQRPLVLVLTPTRELAQQIQNEAQKYLYNGYRSICIYGGVSSEDQIDSLDDGAEIVIATPGRLSDLASRGYINFSHFTYVVLDEADRMLDMGFEPQIKRILVEIRPDRLTALTSATWPESVQKLTQKYTTNGLMVVVGTLDLSTCKDVKQYFNFIDNDDMKLLRIMEIVDYLCKTRKESFKLIIFVRSKILADHLSSEFCLKKINAQGLHGGRSQQDRENSLSEFREGKVQILVATDLASRGIDVPDITHVVNYDFPNEIEEYVHRVGRTGRAGRLGEAMSFLSYRDRPLAASLITVLERSGQKVPSELRRLADNYAFYLKRRESLIKNAQLQRSRKQEHDFPCY